MSIQKKLSENTTVKKANVVERFNTLIDDYASLEQKYKKLIEESKEKKSFDPKAKKKELEVKSALQSAEIALEKIAKLDKELEEQNISIQTLIKEKVSINSDLDVTIKEKKEELEKLLGFETSVFDLSSLLATIDSAKDNLKAWEKEADSMKAAYEKDLMILRRREQDDYNYNITKEKKKLRDDMLEEVATEKERLLEDIHTKEEVANARFEDATLTRDEARKELEAAKEERENIKATIAKEVAIKEASIKRDKEDAIKEMENEIAMKELQLNTKIKSLEEKLSFTNDLLEKAEERNRTLEEKLSVAYSSTQDTISNIASAMKPSIVTTEKNK